MWPVPASRIIISVAAETAGLHRTALFLCSVDDGWNTLAGLPGFRKQPVS